MPVDNQWQQTVLAELDWEPSLVAAHTSVTADVDVVTLTGHVETFAEKHAGQVISVANDAAIG
jgi:hypothetical protein